LPPQFRHEGILEQPAHAAILGNTHDKEFGKDLRRVERDRLDVLQLRTRTPAGDESEEKADKAAPECISRREWHGRCPPNGFVIHASNLPDMDVVPPVTKADRRVLVAVAVVY